MPIDLPNSPSVNDTFTYGTRTVKWNGTYWESIAANFVGYAATTTQSGTSYTLVTADVNSLIVFTNSSAVTVTIPAHSSPSAAWVVGNGIDLLQKGAGQVQLSAAVGVTIRTTSLPKTRDQYSAVNITYIGTNEWLLQGDTAVT